MPDSDDCKAGGGAAGGGDEVAGVGAAAGDEVTGGSAVGGAGAVAGGGEAAGALRALCGEGVDALSAVRGEDAVAGGTGGPGSRLPRPGARTRLRRRIPVRLRHHWRVLAALCAFLALLGTVFGNDRIRPYVTSAERSQDGGVTEDIAGTVDLFDYTVAHQISLTYREDDFQRMVKSFQDDGEKEYVEADLTVDGTFIPSVGIRLKGNSTLSSLRRSGASGGGGFGPGGGGRARAGQDGGPPAGAGGFGAGGFGPGGQAQDDQGGQAQDGQGGQAQDGQGGQAPAGGAQGGQAQDGQGGQVPAGGAQGGDLPGGAAGGMTTLSIERPEELPWLISLDEYVDGRRYQGHREVAVRPAGTGSSTALNEALALSVVDGAGEAAQKFSYSSFTVNDRPTVTRLLVEHPDDNFAATTLGGDGVLYKALSTSQFTDQGEDPIDYQDDFKQINLKGSQDVQPVIDLIRWVGSATDAQFAAQLAEHVDVESFARYLALQNLLLNFDDMAGPGKNYYLWYDLDSRTFRVITWDLNLTFSGDAAQGPYDSSGFGAGRRGGGQPVQQGADPQAQPDGGGQQDGGGQAQGQAPGGFEAPGGGQFPGGADQGGADQGGAGPGAGGGGFGGMGGNQLKERFLATDAFKEVYESAYRELYQKIYASGLALERLNTISAGLRQAPGADTATIDTEAASLRTTIESRTSALATDEVITGTTK